MSGGITYDRGIFADNLKRLMRLNGEKQIDLAQLLDVSKATISGYCAGRQMPRMDKVELLAHHYGVSRAALLGDDEPVTAALAEAAPEPPVLTIYRLLNEDGQAELTRYGRYLAAQPDYCGGKAPSPTVYIKHFLVPAAAGYASPIEGEDYELIPRTLEVPDGADFAITVRGDSMEPYIPDGSLVYVRRGAQLKEFEAGVFFVDGDVYCKQWCEDYEGTLHLLSANPARQDANIRIPRSSGRVCVCFGKVLLPRRLPAPSYYV